jgi:hypothetical protein
MMRRSRGSIFLLHFSGKECVELFPSEMLFSLAGNRLDGVLDLIVREVQIEHLSQFLEVVEGDAFLALLLDQIECLSPSLLGLRIPLP